MNWFHKLLLALVPFCAALPSMALAGPVDDIQTLLNQSRQQTMAMLSEKDKSVLEMRYEDALASSKEIDARLQSALADPALKDKQATLAEFKTVWLVFKSTRDREIVPLLMAGEQDQARALAQKVQSGRFQKMNELLGSARTK